MAHRLCDANLARSLVRHLAEGEGQRRKVCMAGTKERTEEEMPNTKDLKPKLKKYKRKRIRRAREERLVVLTERHPQGEAQVYMQLLHY